jgi:subtilisin family serine protease
MDRVRRQLFLPDDGPKGAGVRVAVLDTGVDLDHPDLAGVVEVAASQNFARLADDLTDRWYHGTHVAGIIAGNGAASNGRLRGIAPAARIVVMKIAANGSGAQGDVAAAIEESMLAKVDIINYSASYSPLGDRGPAPWVWPSSRSAMEALFDAAADAGVLCVVAAGNDGPAPGSINRPGGLASVLTVGAMDGGRVLRQSSRGAYRVLATLRTNGVRRWDSLLDVGAEERVKPDLVAPGEDVFAPRASRGVAVPETMLLDPADPRCHYLKVTGTSQATAVVSGVAACLLELANTNNIDLGANRGATLKSLLVHAARPLADGTRNDFGAGMLNWPVLVQTLRDFAADDRFREIVMNGPRLRLL